MGTIVSHCSRQRDGTAENATTTTSDNACGGCHHAHSDTSLQRVKFPGQQPKAEDKMAAVVVTICDGGSYDAMFSAIPQEGEAGTQVAVYKTSSDSLALILRAFQGDAAALEDGAVAALMADIELVDNDCVVFNWECCGGCDDGGLPRGTADSALELMEHVIGRGSMVMVSDFSLKALIADWRADLFGPNPFVKLGEFGGSFKLSFDPVTLANCSSSQLQKVGEMCSKGHATVKAMGCTICYTVDPKKAAHNAYQLQVLTAVTETGTFNLDAALPSGSDLRCEAGDGSGGAGHVLLTYPSGGTLLTSAGHWVELAKLDVTVESLLAVAEKEYGSDYTAQLRQDLSVESDSMEVRGEKMASWSKRMLTSSAPCSKRVSAKYDGY